MGRRKVSEEVEVYPYTLYVAEGDVDGLADEAVERPWREFWGACEECSKLGWEYDRYVVVWSPAARRFKVGRIVVRKVCMSALGCCRYVLWAYYAWYPRGFEPGDIVVDVVARDSWPMRYVQMGRYGAISLPDGDYHRWTGVWEFIPWDNCGCRTWYGPSYYYYVTQDGPGVCRAYGCEDGIQCCIKIVGKEKCRELFQNLLRNWERYKKLLE